jgi:hypothetical protein
MDGVHGANLPRSRGAWSAACGTLNCARIELIDELGWPGLPPSSSGDRYVWCAPLVDGYCVPRTFRAYLEVSRYPDCAAILLFVSGWENSIVHEKTVRSRYPLVEPAPGTDDMPWSELERIALAWAAVPLAPGLQNWKRQWTVGQIGSAEADPFGKAFDVVYPRLKPRRKARVSEKDCLRAARTHYGLLGGEPLNEIDTANRMHVSPGTVKRYLREWRLRHPGPERT